MDFIFAINELSDNASQGTAQTHLDMLSATWSDFKMAFTEERMLHGTVELDYSIILKNYMMASGKLNDILRSSNVNQSASSNVQFSLPQLKLPEFHGKTTEWKAFISLFNRMVHNNPRADDGVKIEYLKTCIKGDAARIINHLDATPENYRTCYDLLKKRYDNKRELLGKLIDNILTIPIMKNESAEALKSMHDAVYESLMSIKNMGISIANWDVLITHILTRKLDSNTVVHYECQLEDVREPQKLDCFLKYLENRFMALQSATTKAPFNKIDFDKRTPTSNTSSSSFHSSSQKSQKCLFCNENHTIYACANFQKKTPQERFNCCCF